MFTNIVSFEVAVLWQDRIRNLHIIIIIIVIIIIVLLVIPMSLKHETDMMWFKIFNCYKFAVKCAI